MTIRVEAVRSHRPSASRSRALRLVGSLDAGGREVDTPVLKTRLHPRRAIGTGRQEANPAITRPVELSNQERLEWAVVGPSQTDLQRRVVGRVIDDGDDGERVTRPDEPRCADPQGSLDRPVGERRPTLAVEADMKRLGAARRRC